MLEPSPNVWSGQPSLCVQLEHHLLMPELEGYRVTCSIWQSKLQEALLTLLEMLIIYVLQPIPLLPHHTPYNLCLAFLYSSKAK